MFTHSGCIGLTLHDEDLTLRDMMEMVRAASLRGFQGLVQALGGDAHMLLRSQRMPVSLEDEDLLLPVRKVASLLEHAARQLECDDFGLRLAQVQDISILGPVAVAIQNSPTIGEALHIASRYLFVHNQGTSFTPVFDSLPDLRLAELRYEVLTPGVASSRQSFDLMLAGGHRFLSLLGGGHYKLKAAHLPHTPLAAPSIYRRHFGVPVLFEQPNAALIVPRTMFDAPLPQANPMLRGLATSYLDGQLADSPKHLTPRVRLTVSRTLGTSQMVLDKVSAILALHPRRLQRQLAEEGTTFKSVRDTAMQAAALRYLGSTRLPLSQVSALLGLSEQSALTRACKRWFGQTPSSMRRRLSSRTDKYSRPRPGGSGRTRKID